MAKMEIGEGTLEGTFKEKCLFYIKKGKCAFFQE
jgi:hypothetical protein